jgi:hypothetical protein
VDPANSRLLTSDKAQPLPTETATAKPAASESANGDGVSPSTSVIHLASLPSFHLASAPSLHLASTPSFHLASPPTLSAAADITDDMSDSSGASSPRNTAGGDTDLAAQFAGEFPAVFGAVVMSPTVKHDIEHHLVTPHLLEARMVFIRRGGKPSPLTPLYQGPF